MADIVRMTDIPAPTLSNWMSKDRYPRIDQAAKIARALGVSMEWMMTGVEPDDEFEEDIDNPRILHIFSTIRSLDDNQLNFLETVTKFVESTSSVPQDPRSPRKK